jgi:hypothetical protein
MRVRVQGTILVVLASVTVLCVGIPNDVSSQDKEERKGVIEVLVENPASGDATVTLYQDGKAIATKELRFGGRTQFDRLSLGTYEVRFEALGHTTIAKRVLLREGDRSHVVRAKLPKGTGSVVLGAGPSLQELEARIKKLEAAVAKLQKK